MYTGHLSKFRKLQPASRHGLSLVMNHRSNAAEYAMAGPIEHRFVLVPMQVSDVVRVSIWP